MSIVGHDILAPTVIGRCSRVDLIEPVKDILSGVNFMGGSSHKQILDKYPDVKNAFTEEVKTFLKEVMFFNTDIKMTTSWFTNVKKGAFLEPHDHNNSWWSACYYIHENCGTKFLTDFPQIMVRPIMSTDLNSNETTYYPDAGSLLVFPSKLKHNLIPWEEDTTRNSLAFNFMPKGRQGYGDSTYEY